MSHHDDWNAVLGHEMRSPLAAILGYQELIEDGTLGELPAPAADAVRRIRFAATHLLLLIDAMDQVDDAEPPAAIPASAIIADALETVRFDAESRSTVIATGATDVMLMTSRAHACRALALALGAAVKASPGGLLRVFATGAPDSGVSITGAALDPRRDTLNHDVPLTGAGLRLHLGGIAARAAGGALRLDASGAVHIALPARPRSD